MHSRIRLCKTPEYYYDQHTQAKNVNKSETTTMTITRSTEYTN